MRFYNIVITDPASGGILQTFTSMSSGLFGSVTDPGALDVEIDVLQGGFSIPQQGSYIRIWGVPLKMVSQSSNFNRKNITITAGMAKGLPLANPQQQGVIVQGQILPAFGNWIGTAQTIDFILSGNVGQPDAPKNLVLYWKAGTPLSNALQSTLQTAFSYFTVNMNISPKLVYSQDQGGFYDSLQQLNDYLQQISQKILGSTSYSGVNISQRGNVLFVSDGTSATNAKQVNFQDLIGQPTWIGPNEINFRCVMRGDIQIGDTVSMPKTITQQTANFALAPRQNSIFQGSFKVRLIHHTGNFRQPDGASWSTMFNATQEGAGAEQ